MDTRHALRCLTPLPALSLAAVLDGATSAGRPITAAAMSQSLRAHFPNVPLLTEEGKAVRFYDDPVKDKVMRIQLVSTDCSKFCSTITANLVKVQRQLGDRVVMLSLTVNPSSTGRRRCAATPVATGCSRAGISSPESGTT